MGKNTDQKNHSPRVIKKRTPGETVGMILGGIISWYMITWPDKTKSAAEIQEFVTGKMFGDLGNLMTEANLLGKDIETLILDKMEFQNNKIQYYPEGRSHGIHSFVQMSHVFCIKAVSRQPELDRIV